MPERRKVSRPDSTDRRGFPRPPLWLNLAILALALAGSLFAKFHHDSIERQYRIKLDLERSTPGEIARIKQDLAQLDLTRDGLRRELDSRLEYAENLKKNDFYLAIDTSARKLYLQYGDAIAREADLQIGPPREITSRGGKSWTFVPIKGAFTVRGKTSGATWKVPEWVYAMQGKPVPPTLPSVPGGLGEFVIELPNDYIIHTPPPEQSPLRGPRPGSFMISEADMKAIWPRIHDQMRVYIF